MSDNTKAIVERVKAKVLDLIATIDAVTEDAGKDSVRKAFLQTSGLPSEEAVKASLPDIDWPLIEKQYPADALRMKAEQRDRLKAAYDIDFPAALAEAVVAMSNDAPSP